MGRGLSYSLPVTYYELIPTAPVKYYCKILTVICAREHNAGTLRARARARLSRRANELPRRTFAFFVSPSISFRNLFRPPSTPANVETRPPLSRPTSRVVYCVRSTITTTTTITDTRRQRRSDSCKLARFAAYFSESFFLF